jgi:hypothetical protein
MNDREKFCSGLCVMIESHCDECVPYNEPCPVEKHIKESGYLRKPEVLERLPIEFAPDNDERVLDDKEIGYNMALKEIRKIIEEM